MTHADLPTCPDCGSDDPARIDGPDPDTQPTFLQPAPPCRNEFHNSPAVAPSTEPDAIRSQHCGSCGWPASTLKPGEVCGTIPHHDACPNCGGELSEMVIPAGVLQPRMDFGPLKLSNLQPPSPDSDSPWTIKTEDGELYIACNGIGVVTLRGALRAVGRSLSDSDSTTS